MYGAGVKRLVTAIRDLWLDRESLEDVNVKVSNVVFHVPYDPSRKLYLQLKCAKCTNCCRNVNLLLTLRDIKRLKLALGYKTMMNFLDKECILTEVLGQIGYYLKRFSGESMETITKPHSASCRFLTGQKLCSIYHARPTPCREFPYVIFQTAPNRYDVYYAQLEIVQGICTGLRETSSLKKEWITPWVKLLVDCHIEIRETVDAGLLKKV